MKTKVLLYIYFQNNINYNITKVINQKLHKLLKRKGVRLINC